MLIKFPLFDYEEKFSADFPSKRRTFSQLIFRQKKSKISKNCWESKYCSPEIDFKLICVVGNLIKALFPQI